MDHATKVKLINVWLQSWLAATRPGFRHESDREIVARLYDPIAKVRADMIRIGDENNIFRMQFVFGTEVVHALLAYVDGLGKVALDIPEDLSDEYYSVVFQVLMQCGGTVGIESHIAALKNNPLGQALGIKN